MAVSTITAGDLTFIYCAMRPYGVP